MSIQLIVFPQSYNGQYNVITLGSGNNMLADSQMFASAAGGATVIFPTYVLSGIGQQLIPAYGVWQKYKISGMLAGPSVSAGVLGLPGEAGAEGSGVYQRITGLNTGTAYEINLNFANSTAGLLTIAVYDGAIQTQINYRVTNTASITPVTFTAANTEQTLILHYDDDNSGIGDTCQIEDVIMSEEGQTPTFATNILSDGQVILDLYEDEDIPLTLSIDDFKNAAEKVQSYSKAFKLPATKRNNKIFDNIFEITRADDGVVFNPYRKTQSILKQDGFTLFEGYLRLIDITDKNGEISYQINLYSEAVALADVLGDKTLNDLDLSELDGTYTYANIRNSWGGTWNLDNALSNLHTVAGNTGDTTTDVIKFPFVDWAHQYTVDATTGMPILPSVESSFRPFIKLKYIIDRIFTSYFGPAFPFRYTSEFFNSADFGNLFMDFNWGEAEAPQVFSGTGFLTIGSDILVNSGSYGTIPFNTYANLVNLNNIPAPDAVIGYSAGVITPTTTNQFFNITYDIDLDNFPLVTTVLDIRWLITRGSGALEIIDPYTTGVMGAGETYQGAFSCTLDTGDDLKCQVRKNAIATFDGIVEDKSAGVLLFDTAVAISTSVNQTTTSSLLQTLRGEIGQWEFLKGIMTMFNLVAIPDKSDKNNIIIEPYKDIFVHQDFGTTLADRKILHDWTEKIDLTQIKLKPLTNLKKKTIFKFVEDDDDYAFNLYKQSVQGHLYGSKTYDASGFTILTGMEEIVAEPFAATFIKPLMTQYPDFIVPTIYSYNSDDGTSEPFNNAPRIMIDNGIKTLASDTYYVPPKNGDPGDAFEDEYLCFSHLSPMPGILGGTDFHFGECQLAPGVGVAPVDNLFNTYWLPYYSQLYNPNTRIMTLKVNLKAGDISKFNMFDTVMIKNREFRVNKIDYKPNDLAKVEFILVN